jgi:heme/copper-type cytochrome/quinol oxidase subunit 2
MSWDWEQLKKDQRAKGNIDPSKKKEKFDIWDSWIPVVAYVVVAIVLVVTFWYIYRWVNYKFSYEPKMKQVIIEMVKPESLKDQYRKEDPDGSKKM